MAIGLSGTTVPKTEKWNVGCAESLLSKVMAKVISPGGQPDHQVGRAPLDAEAKGDDTEPPAVRAKRVQSNSPARIPNRDRPFDRDTHGSEVKKTSMPSSKDERRRVRGCSRHVRHRAAKRGGERARLGVAVGERQGPRSYPQPWRPTDHKGCASARAAGGKRSDEAEAGEQADPGSSQSTALILQGQRHSGRYAPERRRNSTLPPLASGAEPAHAENRRVGDGIAGQRQRIGLVPASLLVKESEPE